MFKNKHELEPGDRVRSTAGNFPFQGRVGTVQEVKRRTCIVCWDDADALERRIQKVFTGALRPLIDPPKAA